MNIIKKSIIFPFGARPVKISEGIIELTKQSSRDGMEELDKVVLNITVHGDPFLELEYVDLIKELQESFARKKENNYFSKVTVHSNVSGHMRQKTFILSK